MNWSNIVFYKDGHLYWHPVLAASDKLGHYRSKLPLGAKDRKGYVRFKYRGEKYSVHRVIWELEVGPIPEDKTVDHWNRDRGNNLLSNLNLATRSEQNMNKDKMKVRPGGSQFKGVAKGRGPGKWRLFVNGVYRGRFDNEEDAATAYNFLAYEIFGDRGVYNSVSQPWLQFQEVGSMLVRAPALQAGGHKFESCNPHHNQQVTDVVG